MFKFKSAFRAADAGADAGGGESPNAPTVTQPAAPAVDVQAAVAKALADQQADFKRQLKELTGHDDLKALSEARLKEQGKLQELADAKAAEAQTYKARYESTLIENALLAASAEAVDPSVVLDLLKSKATVNDSGAVSLDGQSAEDAVKALLATKPFLAKAQGGTGSGAPANAGTGDKNPWSKEHFNLTEQLRLNKENPAKAAQLKAAAGQ